MTVILRGAAYPAGVTAVLIRFYLYRYMWYNALLFFAPLLFAEISCGPPPNLPKESLSIKVDCARNLARLRA